MVYNMNSSVTSFDHNIVDYVNVSVLVGLNGFSAQAGKNITWNMVIDSDGKGLTFSQRDLNVVNMSILVIGVYDNWGINVDSCNDSTMTNSTVTNSSS